MEKNSGNGNGVCRSLGAKQAGTICFGIRIPMKKTDNYSGKFSSKIDESYFRNQAIVNM